MNSSGYNVRTYISGRHDNQAEVFIFQEGMITRLKSLYPDVFLATSQNPDPRLDRKILRNNFLKVVVSYEDLNHEIIREQQSYSVSETYKWCFLK